MEKLDPEKVNLFNSPILSLRMLARFVVGSVVSAVKFCVKHLLLILLPVSLLLAAIYLPGPHHSVWFT